MMMIVTLMMVMTVVAVVVMMVAMQFSFHCLEEESGKVVFVIENMLFL